MNEHKLNANLKMAVWRSLQARSAADFLEMQLCCNFVSAG